MWVDTDKISVLFEMSTMYAFQETTYTQTETL